jgi:hypothetical protein
MEVRGKSYEVRGKRYEVRGKRHEVQSTEHGARGIRYEGCAGNQEQTLKEAQNSKFARHPA